MHSSCTPLRTGLVLSRRTILTGLTLGLAACNPNTPVVLSAASPKPHKQVDPRYQSLPNERFPVPAIEDTEVPPQYRRQRIRYETSQHPGTVIVDPGERFLYLVQEEGYALRYGVGVGREGFGWTGTAEIARKAQWPTWTPPAEMIKRQPELKVYAGGMAPSLENPLGARALYLYQNGRDTLYRLHGTNEPSSIGQNVSSGCIRLINQDIIDLYQRVPTGTKVVVLPHSDQA
jgi:lipoprotein-anchoring transpeptidase ErfK/SrfK